MKRIESPRRLRAVPGRTRNAAEAMIAKLQVAFERQRLEKEHSALVKRVRQIEVRLRVLNPEPAAASVIAPRLPMANEVTLQY